MKWTKEFPTQKDVGKWYFTKYKDGKWPTTIQLVEVRWDEGMDDLYICQISNEGMQTKSYGTRLSLYDPKYYSFCEMGSLPPDFQEIRQEWQDFRRK